MKYEVYLFNRTTGGTSYRYVESEHYNQVRQYAYDQQVAYGCSESSVCGIKDEDIPKDAEIVYLSPEYGV